jgi:signal transduction histidine kinase
MDPAAMLISSRLFVQSTIAFLVVGLLALLSIIGMTFWLGERAQVYFNDVIRARDLRGSVVELRNAVVTAESSQRGFLVTGSEIYLAPYGSAKSAAQRQIKAVAAATPNGETDVSVQTLASLLQKKFVEMDRTIALKREFRDEEALGVIRDNRGKALMDEANVFFSGIIRAADDLLTKAVEEEKANALRLRWVSIVGGIVIVLVGAGATFTVLRYTRELMAARDEVRHLNAGLEKRVKDRTEDLATANDEMRRFVHIVSHDLRAPLVNIMGFTSELEESMGTLQAFVGKADAAHPATAPAHAAVSVDLPEAVGFIRSSTKKMDDLISAILKLSREGRRKLVREQVDLDELISATSASIQHQLSEAGAEIMRELEVSIVETDRLALEQILGNLLDNAVKYRAPERPLRVVVRSKPYDDRVVLEVADNGRGIAAQDQERVFELFRRAGKQDQPGEGVGLAYVRTLVQNLGGTVHMTSVIGEGTVFRITLPRKTEMAGAA